MRVVISELCDGFDIILYNIEGEMVSHHHFDQEDSVQGLVGVFQEMGIPAAYEESY